VKKGIPGLAGKQAIDLAAIDIQATETVNGRFCTIHLICHLCGLLQ
jgi:hypothetical protein